MPESGDRRQRLDKWLWYARIVKSRTLAQRLIASGGVRVDRVRVTQPARKIVVGQVLTLSYADRLRVLRVLAPGTRRGPAAEAETLYEDLSPEVPRAGASPNPVSGARPAGAGRPTKRQRRQIDRLKSG